jgi:7-cyano-7-deazaguanine synthase
MVVDTAKQDQIETAVLYSGGLDSAVLVAHEAQRFSVQPVYVSVGLAWEAAELKAAHSVLAALVFDSRVRPLVCLTCPVTDVYSPTHWAIQGTPPAYHTSDGDVYLVGRNVILLAKVALFCATRTIHRLALGPLAGNPFPDATPEFFAAMSRALSLGLDHQIDIAFPLGSLHKEDVIKLGASLGVPFDLTLSCMNPAGGRHCARCSKCRERREGFAAAGITDPAQYSSV